MKLIAGGTFTMGSDDDSFPLWKPAHKVTIDSFCLGQYEVTVAEFDECVASKKCEPASARPSFPKLGTQSDAAHQTELDAFAELCNAGKKERAKHPINCVSFHAADAYCKSLGARLPTEAEWELAARGTDGRTFPWGDDVGNHSYMNAAGPEWREWLGSKGLAEPSQLMFDKSDGYVGTAPVGRYPRAQTQDGIYDMVGNVWEWTSDWYALYKDEHQMNPKGAPAGKRKAIRGGGFNGEHKIWIDPAARYHQEIDAVVHAIGFRCAANLIETK